MKKDYFENKAASYEDTNHRVENVNTIAQCLLGEVTLDSTMSILDFGSGTGLLLEKIAPYVKKITAVDVSESMNKQLELKSSKLSCELEILTVDLTLTTIDQKYDGIISSMTLHHIENTRAIFETFYVMLKNNAFIAIADLDIEDGSFHTEDTGVYHTGFDRLELENILSDVGFKDICIKPASIVHKPQGDYSVFLLTATK